MTVIMDDSAVRDVFDWRSAIEAVRQAYRNDLARVRYPERAVARGDHGWLRTLSGVPGGAGMMGAKLIAFARGTRQASYLVALFDQTDAALVGLLDGNSVTGYRTAATSALAADLLARDEPWRIALIGSGFEAANHLRALASIRDLASVTVFSPREQSRRRFVKQFADASTAVTAASSAAEAVAGATLVVCAARSHDESPTFLGSWLRPGMTVLSIGSTLPEQREVDSETLRRADVIIADELKEVVEQTGDAIAAREAAIEIGDRTRSLADLVTGRCSGRTSHDQIVVYKSVGSAVQDLAVAEMCLRRAQKRGITLKTTAAIQPVVK